MQLLGQPLRISRGHEGGPWIAVTKFGNASHGARHDRDSESSRFHDDQGGSLGQSLPFDRRYADHTGPRIQSVPRSFVDESEKPALQPQLSVFPLSVKLLAPFVVVKLLSILA